MAVRSKASQWHEIFGHDAEVMSSTVMSLNPRQVKLWNAYSPPVKSDLTPKYLEQEHSGRTDLRKTAHYLGIAQIRK